MAESSQYLRTYFASIRGQLMAAATSSAPHAGLAGGHRESLVRDYLTRILPRRLEIGRGMVFGVVGQTSREADVVVWDSANYPCLRHSDHQLFFPESTRLVLEAKSRWSTAEFEDILDKCAHVRNIMSVYAPNLADEIAVLQMEVQSLREGRAHDGMILARPQIATAAFVFAGGQSFRPETLDPEWVRSADDAWPDVMLLLEPGIVVGKHYVTGDGPFSGRGYLEFLELGDDCLLKFTTALMALVNDRSVQVEDPTYLSTYVDLALRTRATETIEFTLTRPLSGRTPIWKSDAPA